MTTLRDYRPQRHNANKGKSIGLTQLDKSIRRDGYSAPMVAAADGEVFAGSKRLERSADVFGLDVEPIVVHSDGTRPVIHVRDDIETADDPRAIRLGVADNAIAHLDYDPDGELLAALAANDADLAEMVRLDDLSAAAVAEFTAGEPQDAEPQIDRAAELQVKWDTRAGDLWLIGEHRMLCGDSTVRADVERVMQGEKSRLCHTDPPYGVDYANVVGVRANQKVGGWHDIENDALDNQELEEFLFKALSLTDAPVLLCWHSWRRVEVFLGAIRRAGWKENAEIIWVKNALVFGMSDYQWRHETCIYAKRDGAGRQKDRKQTTVWEFNKTINALHPTQKPTELFMAGIENHTEIGDIVYEPFAGAGGNLIACENLHRRCRAIEISPAYTAVCLERMATAFQHLRIERAA